MSINYKCKRCGLFETIYYSGIKKHCDRKKYCKKNINYINLSDDQILCLTLLPYYDNIHCIKLEDIKHLDKSNILDNNKRELFDLLNNIEKNKIKTCNYCNQKFNYITDLKKHVILHCFFNSLKKEVDKNNNIDSINNLYNNCDINNNTNNYIFFEINTPNKTPIPFDNDWDISKISDGDKSKIMISNFMYTKLLDEILKNNENLNVIIDKEKESGMVYKNDNEQYKQMTLQDIVDTTMTKLHKHLNDINKNDNGESLKEVITFTRQIIDKKYIDYNKNDDIKDGVTNCISKSYDKKKDDAISIAKNISKNNLYNGY